ncbi:PTS transporter subunit EIIC [Tepidimicrobium xylanilyticum]|uniref:PTS system IIB component, Glc family (TC 4.A.1)/PTS system IIC component, Glc family (TC 4.A.1) n=1 Tax=Tepidimicrobium xylanilyticum TaxID=1123352 RepID=A0A1H2Q224_9FIRM|nr:PTS transporter subunit EIIC [Tepidimicrobium xylanilyticum]GMG95776.1 PTS maltose transporter subunit IICB [Tepidimicrobium xylanilyticum]SDW01143.1 PTS system IIB component, Glc family (TC 4.A.1)/PTS system IIC component, Glc family (TC 4.A.1) [Tepidimicrobium xylanilyticum]
MTKRQKLNEAIQRFGRSLLLPIAVMAPVGMILGLTGALVQSYMIEKLPFLGTPTLNTILISLRDIANVIFNNTPILFAMGVAYGVSKKEKGIAVFSSIISYLILNATINVWLIATGNLASAEEMAQVGQGMVLGIQTLRLDVLGGIISGLIAAILTDRYHDKELPVAFAFFSGKKFVPIVSIGVTIIVGLIVPFIWQYVTKALISMSSLILSGYIGVFLNIVMVRLLIPFGLHHVWSAMLRFTPAGGVYTIAGEEFVGVLPALNKILFDLGPSHEAWEMVPSLTRFMAQNQMLVTLFMIPAIGLAMYKTAYDKNKKFVKGIILTMVLTPFLGNVTEPMEFSFLFIAPLLYIWYVFLAASGAVVLAALKTGVGYIRGTIFDFAIFGLMYENTKWYNILIVGIPLAIITYFTFSWAIKKFNIPTPGREEDDIEYNALLQEKRYDEIAKIVIEALGGRQNIVNVENCVTRLRIDLKDMHIVDKERLKESGTSGIFFPAKNHIHIVFGPSVEFVKNAVDSALQGKVV